MIILYKFISQVRRLVWVMSVYGVMRKGSSLCLHYQYRNICKIKVTVRYYMKEMSC